MLDTIDQGKKYTASFLIFGISFALYWYSLLPDVGQGDTAKFQFVGYILGTPHTTGYPLYIFLNFLFTHLFPFGSLAFKANLLSALLAALGLVFTYQLLLEISLNRFISSIAALVFGFTPTLWSQSIIAEVYSFNFLFVTLVTRYLIRWSMTRLEKHLLLALGFYAFSFGNHLLMITMLPAIFILILQTDKSVFFNWKIISAISLLVFLAILQYGYIFVVTYLPRKTYLEMTAPDLKTFWWYVTGAQFKRNLFGFTWRQFFFERIPLYAHLLKREFWALPLLTLPGLWALRRNPLFSFFLLIFLGNLVFALNYSVGDFSNYLIPGYFIIATLIFLGFSSVIQYFQKQSFIKIGTYTVIFLLPFLFFFINYPKVSLRNHGLDKEFAESILSKVGNNAIMISPKYEFSETMWYYLIGLDLEQKRNLYLVHHWNLEVIEDYIKRKSPLYLPEERIFVPFSLDVYCLSEHQAEKFRYQGLSITKVNENLYRVY